MTGAFKVAWGILIGVAWAVIALNCIVLWVMK